MHDTSSKSSAARSGQETEIASPRAIASKYRSRRSLAIVVAIAIGLYLTGPNIEFSWRDAAAATPGSPAGPGVYGPCRPGSNHIGPDPRLCVPNSSAEPFYDADIIQPGSPAIPATPEVRADHHLGLYLMRPAVRLLVVGDRGVFGFGIRNERGGYQ
jgi:hypothetical protein